MSVYPSSTPISLAITKNGTAAKLDQFVRGGDGIVDDRAQPHQQVLLQTGHLPAREQAASCQKVLGGFANICYEYATKRYRSNCINWGIVPFTMPAHLRASSQTLPSARMTLAVMSSTPSAMAFLTPGTYTRIEEEKRHGKDQDDHPHRRDGRR